MYQIVTAVGESNNKISVPTTLSVQNEAVIDKNRVIFN